VSDRPSLPAIVLLVVPAVSLLAITSAARPPGVSAQGHAASGHGAATDTRQRLPLTAAEVDAVRAEMRQMLASVSGILQGLATDNPAAVENAAKASGMAAAVDPHLEQKLPDVTATCVACHAIYRLAETR
jgi:hypothetical protein